MTQFQLVKTRTSDNIYLSGLFVEGDTAKPAVVYLHGFEGDFYSHKFIIDIANTFDSNKFTLLSVQTRGTGGKTWFLDKEGNAKYIGSHFELLEEAFLDIDAWVKFLVEKGYENIIIAGHSLGTIKVIRYLFEGELKDMIKKLVLMCPFDKNGQENLVTRGKWRTYLNLAKKKIDQGKGTRYILKGWEEVNMSYQTFYSWYQEDDLGSMFDFYRPDYDFPVLNRISIPVHILVGTKDEFFHRTNPDNPQEAMDILLKNLKHGSGKLIENAKHSFGGYEEKLVNSILDFLSQ